MREPGDIFAPPPRRTIRRNAKSQILNPQRGVHNNTSSSTKSGTTNTSYDAIVVGSGISGGWAAKELTEKGLRVLMLERGKNIEHIKDYVNATKAPWEYPHRGGRTRAMEEAYPGPQARLPAQREEPRLLGERQGVAVHRGQALRLVSRLSRRRPLADVGTPELPLERLRLRGERARKASPSTGRSATRTSRRGTTTSRSTPASPARTKDMPQLPDGQFQPAMPLNCGEEIVAGHS